MTATGYVSATGDSRKVNVAGDTMTGALVLPGDPVSDLQAADKHYVDSQVAGVPTTRRVDTTAPLTGGGDLSANRTLAVSNATAGAVGVVQLAGDLAGTATSPTVPGLSGKVAASTATTKGDLLVATASATIARLGVGSNNQVLTADSSQTAGVKWGSAPAGATFPLSGTGLLAASINTEHGMNGSNIANNQAFVARTYIPAGVTITKLWAACRDAGTWDGATAGSTLGIYDDSGTFIDKIGTSDSLWTATGWVGGSLSAGAIAAQATGRFVYIAALVRGMTSAPVVAFLTSANDSAGNLVWYNSGPSGSGATNRRAFYLGVSSLPASFTPASAGTATTYTVLVGVT